jgi:hypothetical protein
MGTLKSDDYVEKPLNPISQDVAKVLGSQTLPYPQIPITLNPIPANSTYRKYYATAKTLFGLLGGVAKNKRLIITHLDMKITNADAVAYRDGRLTIYDNTLSVLFDLIICTTAPSSENTKILPSPVVLEPNSLIYYNPETGNVSMDIVLLGYEVDI